MSDIDRKTCRRVMRPTTTIRPGTDTVDPAVCPRCRGANQEAFELCASCSGTGTSECVASVSGNCLREQQSEGACDTEANECVYGGRPGAEVTHG